MSDLLLWYERELSWFRHQAGHFASDHPGLARTLGISDEAVEDPDVARLVESVALLNARLAQQLDEELPQLTDALLMQLFPHFLRPLPATGMMQMAPSADISSVQQIPAGSRFRGVLQDDRHCDFRNCCPVQLLPFRITAADMEQTPFSLPAPGSVGNPGVMLRLDLCMCDTSTSFHTAGDLKSLDVCLKGELNLTQRLYDQLFSQVLGVVLFDESGTEVRLGPDALQPVLMDADERLLPITGNTFPGYQLLLEYLAFQQLFLSFRIVGLEQVLAGFTGHQLSLGIYLDSVPVELGRSITAENFQLGCAPVVNLYQRLAEPVRVDQARLSYPLVIDSRSINCEQVFSVDRVLDITATRPLPLPSVYGRKYGATQGQCYWHFQPSFAEHSQGDIALTRADLEPAAGDTRQLSPTVTCYNGDQPLALDLLHTLSCQDNIATPVPPRLMGKTSASWRPDTGHGNRWALLAHLQANFESLLGAKDPAAELRELLTLYNVTGHSGQRRCIEAVTGLQGQPVVAPVKVHGRQCYLQGTDIILTLDGARISGVAVMAFIQVLDRLLAGYAGHNSFTRLQVCMKGENGVFYQCPRRLG